MRSIVARRAARGAEFMDVVHPTWIQEVESKDLDMMHPKKCIWGQIYGDYGVGFKQTGLSIMNAVRYGFIQGTIQRLFFCSSSQLTNAWRREIEQRRVQDYLMRARAEDENPDSEQEVAVAGL